MIERFGKKIQLILRRTIFYDSYMQKRLVPFSTHVPDGQGCKLVNITRINRICLRKILKCISQLYSFYQHFRYFSEWSARLASALLILTEHCSHQCVEIP